MSDANKWDEESTHAALRCVARLADDLRAIGATPSIEIHLDDPVLPIVVTVSIEPPDSEPEPEGAEQ